MKWHRDDNKGKHQGHSTFLDCIKRIITHDMNAQEMEKRS